MNRRDIYQQAFYEAFKTKRPPKTVEKKHKISTINKKEVKKTSLDLNKIKILLNKSNTSWKK